MVVMVATNYPVAKTLVSKLYNEHQMEFCAIEAEYGDGSLTTKDVGVMEFFNHHANEEDPKQPCRAFVYTTKEFQNFCISHIDVDTIFGIGWLCGIFKYTQLSVYNKLVVLSNLISNVDNFGIHNLAKEYLATNRKELDVIYSYVAHARNQLQKSKFKNYYNCSSIIIKVLHNIIKALTHRDILESRFQKIQFEDKTKNKIFKLKESNKFNGEVHIYNKKINNFMNDNHNFILIYDFTVSMYGRDNDITKKYFPEGLHNFLDNIIPGSGGHFAAAGTPRKVKVTKHQYLKIVQSIENRIIPKDNND